LISAFVYYISTIIELGQKVKKQLYMTTKYDIYHMQKEV
jgi:hypothetical protein